MLCAGIHTPCKTRVYLVSTVKKTWSLLTEYIQGVVLKTRVGRIITGLFEPVCKLCNLDDAVLITFYLNKNSFHILGIRLCPH